MIQPVRKFKDEKRNKLGLSWAKLSLIGEGVWPGQ